eukprot:TRINITY_DN35130_c0_g1_i2.p1 TRINITY_DN35130_c0_g1~~TRINITY_DN35130_c0_g1_i2.p1  ORF type:complete len:281 (-),score=54.89 TRINITY_DN35130_c0_g1_i2:6-848(-)
MNIKALIRKAKTDSGGYAGAQSNPPAPAGSKVGRGGLSDADEADPELWMQRLPELSDSCRISSGPPTVKLLEEWLPPEAEAFLLNHLRAQEGDFLQLRGKRTARYGGEPGPPFVPETLPPWLQHLCEAVGKAASLSPVPNHVLVNHYQPGQGIMPHTDGPAYQPRAAIVSLGSAVVFDFWRDHAHTAGGEAPTLSILLPPRSLLVFSDEAYCSHLHGIADRRFDDLEGTANWTPEARSEGPDGDELWRTRQLTSPSCLKREERYSLTIRHVPAASEAAAT